VVDALEEFLGAPVTSSKIEGSYDIVAQLLTEMCDAGVVSTTEPNALREMVEVEGFLERVLGGVGLNAYVSLCISLSLSLSLSFSLSPLSLSLSLSLPISLPF